MKKENKQQQKQYFDIKMEVLLPATVTYRVIAEDAEKALEQINNTTSPNSIKYHLTKKKILKAMVYDAGCSVIKFIKNFGAK